MNTVDKVLITVYVSILAGMFILFPIACTRVIDNTESGLPAGVEESEPYFASFGSNEPAWTKYEHGEIGLDLEYPTDWQLAVVPGDGQTQPDYYLTVKNTALPVLYGGAVPDDYYVEKDGKNVVNSQKYADNFIVFSVSVYQSLTTESWSDFFQISNPGLVNEFEQYQVPNHDDLKAVHLTAVDGLIVEDQLFFVRTDKAIYEFSLIHRNSSVDEAVLMFNEFLGKFNFDK